MSVSGSRPVFTFTHVTPSARCSSAILTEPGTSRAHTTSLMRTRSRTLPPSNWYTGTPAAFPAMSHSAISTADFVNGFSLMMKSIARRAAVMSRGSLPINCGAMYSSMTATVPRCVSPDHSPEMVASPSPTRPASV